MKEKLSYSRGCLWLTGLPCSGKSTLAAGLRQEFLRQGAAVMILDGDVVRKGLSKDLGFSPEDRQENVRRVAEAAKLFVEEGFVIIVALVSPYNQDRDKARALFTEGEFTEIFVKTELAVCEARDTKGLYKKARQGEVLNFTGVSAPYEIPLKPELVIDTALYNERESIKRILEYLHF